MSSDRARSVLADVPRLSFGPQSDLFCSALQIALRHGGDEVEYPELLCTSGRAFLICWSDEMFFWDRHMEAPDADPEHYLRGDYESAARALAAAGYDGQVIVNSDCSHLEPRADTAAESGPAVRELVLASIGNGRPVVAAMSISATRWAPEWTLLTGFDDDGDVVTGWSCFQEDEQEQAELSFEDAGYFRKTDWEKDTLAAVRIREPLSPAPERDAVERQSLDLGVCHSQGAEVGHTGWGFEAYERWAQALQAEDIVDLDEDTLRGRLDYHTHFVGHLAAQKWYTACFLKDMQTKVWSLSDILHAAACYARIHELMWEVWKVAGGYWRDRDAEVTKFRDPAARAQIAALITEAQGLDEAAVEHLEGGLAAWDKTHAHYTRST